MAWLTVLEYLCHKWPWIYSTCRKHFPVLSSFTGYITRLTRWVPLVEQELLTLPEHLSSPPVFSGVRVTRSLALCDCVVCSSLIYGFWLPLWYLQTSLNSDGQQFHQNQQPQHSPLTLTHWTHIQKEAPQHMRQAGLNRLRGSQASSLDNWIYSDTCHNIFA
jgi:hypothetical protein